MLAEQQKRQQLSQSPKDSKNNSDFDRKEKTVVE
jgi:hypothetical protein